MEKNYMILLLIYYNPIKQKMEQKLIVEKNENFNLL